jgi:hypothetical protein
VWDNVPDGTRNAEDRESGPAGGNMRDYRHNASSVSQDMYGDAWTVLRRHELHCQSGNP